MPWEISVALAGVALLALAAVAAVTVLQIRQTSRSVSVLSASVERHVPAILRNLDEIRLHVEALRSSIEALSEKAGETGRGFETIAGNLQAAAGTLEETVLGPLRKIAKGVSILLAVGSALRGLRHPFSKVRRRRQGKS